MNPHPDLAELRADSDVQFDESHPFNVWLREFHKETHGLLSTLGHKTAALNAWNAALDAAALRKIEQDSAATGAQDRYSEIVGMVCGNTPSCGESAVVWTKDGDMQCADCGHPMTRALAPLGVTRELLINCRRLICGRAGRGNEEAQRVLHDIDAALSASTGEQRGEMNPIEQAKEALQVLYSHGTSHITNARSRMLIQNKVESALAALEAEQSASGYREVGHVRRTLTPHGSTTECPGVHLSDLPNGTKLYAKIAGEAEQSGPQARHWKQAVREFFDSYPCGGDVPYPLSREDWIEQLARSLAAVESTPPSAGQPR